MAPQLDREASVSSALTSLPSTSDTFEAAVSTYSSSHDSIRPLPKPLQQQIQVYFEETLLSQSLHVILRLLAAPAIVYSLPTDHLEILANLAVHPSFTSRTKDREMLTISTTALRILKLYLKLVGTHTTGLREAFSFRKFDLDINTKQSFDESLSDATPGKSYRVVSPYVEDESLYVSAEDFWQVVGWAFNCASSGQTSALYGKRWEIWAPWLEYMLDILETDWRDHSADKSYEDSLIWLYVSTTAGPRDKGRRIVNALFADGHENHSMHFREVYRKELRLPKAQKKQLKQSTVRVDVDEEIYGDYLNQTSSSNDDNNQPSSISIGLGRPVKLRKTSRTTRHRTAKSAVGHNSKALPGIDDTQDKDIVPVVSLEVMRIRNRFMNILHSFSSISLTTQRFDFSFCGLPELYMLYAEKILSVSLSEFAIYTLQTPTTSLSQDVQQYLNCFFLERLYGSNTVRRSRWDTAYNITTEEIEEYIQLTAEDKSANANARSQLCLEGLIRSMLASSLITNPIRLSELCQARKTVLCQLLGQSVETNKRRKAKHSTWNLDTEDAAFAVVKESLARLDLLLSV